MDLIHPFIYFIVSKTVEIPGGRIISFIFYFRLWGGLDIDAQMIEMDVEMVTNITTGIQWG